MICKHFGWTLEYLTHGIPFNTVQKMMRDFPQFDFDDNNDEYGYPSEIKEQSTADLAAMLNNFSYE